MSCAINAMQKNVTIVGDLIENAMDRSGLWRRAFSLCRPTTAIGAFLGKACMYPVAGGVLSIRTGFYALCAVISNLARSALEYLQHAGSGSKVNEYLKMSDDCATVLVAEAVNVATLGCFYWVLISCNLSD